MLSSQTAAGMETVAAWYSHSLMVAALSLLIQECMKPQMLFARYKLLLLHLWRSNWRRNDRWKRTVYMLKPLGLCIYCQAVWISAIYYAVRFGINLEMLLFIGMVFLWVKIFVKLGLN